MVLDFNFLPYLLVYYCSDGTFPVKTTSFVQSQWPYLSKKTNSSQTNNSSL